MNTTYILISIATMALTTYIIRVVPMVVFRKRIQSNFIRSFLHYVPYTVLAAMTFPAIFYSTASVPSAVCATVLALVLAYCGKSLITVALGSALCALIVNLLGI